ncbi:MAG: MG2 domain-containing protein [Deinococcaceae bacterium]
MRRFLASTLVLMGIGVAGASSYAYLYGSGTYSSIQDVNLNFEVSEQQKIDVFKIRSPQKLLTLGGPRDFSKTGQLDLDRVRTVSIGQTRRYGSVNLGRLPKGVYLAQLGNSPSAKAILILVTDLGLVTKTDDKQMLAYTANLISGKPQVSTVYLMEKGTILNQVTSDKQGLAQFKTAKGGKENVYIAANFGNDWVFSSSFLNSWNQETYRVFLATDRPVYRPGDTVAFKGIAKAAIGLKPISQRSTQLRVLGSDDKELLKATFQTDAYGAFDGQLRIPLDAPLGTYRFEGQLDGQAYEGSFDVAEYVKPEYSVDVTTPKTALVQGQKTQFNIHAEYLFGGGVSGGKVNYSVVKTPLYSNWLWFEDEQMYDSKIIVRKEALLDDKGNLSVEVPLERDSNDYTLSFEANVTDEARREVSGSANLTAYRSNVIVSADTRQYAYPANENVDISVSAEDLSGHPVSVPFTVEVQRNSWDVVKRSYASQKVTLLSGKTDTLGKANIAFKTPKQGDYTFTVKAKDDAGNATESSTNIWAYDGSPWYWNYTTLDIKSDRPEYKVGDNALLTVQSPIQNGYALITFEGTGLGRSEIVPIKGSVLNYSVPITVDMQPNTYVGVTLIGNGQYYTDLVNLKVPPKDKYLNVGIQSDQKTYKPGDTAHFDFSLSDWKNKPVQAQLSLGWVDEGVYLVRPESNDIKAFFYAERGNVVGTETGGNYYFGDAVPLAKSGQGGSPDLDEAVFAQNKEMATARLRSQFRDTALWLPKVETDALGKAHVSVKLPDNLTTWRLTSRAVTLGDQVGEDIYKIQTTLPVIARLATPRFLVRSDKSNFRVIAQSNLTSQQQASLELKFGNATLAGATDPVSLPLPAGSKRSVDFAVEAQAAGTATLQAAVRTPAASDALEVSLPVLPKGIPRELTWAGESGTTWNFALPEKTALETVKAKLFLTPSLVEAVAPALRYLTGYPYGCTEQTLSRFVPNLLAKRLGHISQVSEDFAQNVDQYTEEGLKRLLDFQHEDGGWGFWQNDDSSVFMTSNVLLGLMEAKASGYAVRDDVIRQGVAYLAQQIARPSLNNPNAKAYAHYALARTGYPKTGLDDILREKGLTAYGLSLGILAYLNSDQKEKAEAALDRLMKMATIRNQTAHWNVKTTQYAWNDDDVEATALALEALTRLRPTDPMVSKVVQWLLLERKGERWVSTKDTAAVVRSALLLSKVRKESDMNLNVSVQVGGVPVVDLGVKNDASNGIKVTTNHVEPGFSVSPNGLEIDLSTFQKGNNTLSISTSGTGNLYASANVRYVSEEEYLRPTYQGIRVARSYQSLQPTFNAKEGRYIYNKMPLSKAVKAGDLVWVTLSVAPEKADMLRYVMVNEPIPAGFSAVEDDWAIRVAEEKPRYGYDYFGWNYWFDGREIRDNHLEFYFSYVNRPVTFNYILRAQTAGQYTALPTEAFLMYDPEVRGTGTVKRIEIKD